MTRAEKNYSGSLFKLFFIRGFYFFPFLLACMTYRKIPGINTYTAEQPEKEQEVIPTVTSIDVPNPGGEKSASLERVDAQPDLKSRGMNAPAPSSVLFLTIF